MSEAKINKASISGKLYRNDMLHLERRVKLFKNDDPKFKDNSAALRHYVHLGIKAEARNLKGELDQTNGEQSTEISTRKFGFNDPLLPIKNSIDALAKAIEESAKEQKNYFIGQSNALGNLRNEILTQLEVLETNRQTLAPASSNGENSERFLKEILKNIIALRCIHYVFLLGVSPGTKVPIQYERIEWSRVVTAVHEKAEKISLAELESISFGDLKNSKLKDISQEMFGIIQGTR